MTNRQWLMWQLIDMSDEELAVKMNGRGWFCDICPKRDRCYMANCEKEFIKWLKQEHVERGDELK